MSKPSLKALVTEAESILSQLEAVKALYNRLDELTVELMDKDLSKSRLELVDNFLDKEGKPKNVAWKASGIRRFELKVRK